MTFNKLPKLAEHMASTHNMKMELPAARSNRVQIKSSKNNASPMADGNMVAMVSDAELVSNYPNNVGDNFIGIMEIKNEFAGNVQ